MLSIFSCAYRPSVCFLWRNVYLGLLPIFRLGCLLLSCMRCLYILEIKPLSVASFANIFSHSVGYLFILFVLSFAVQNLVSFIRSCLFLLLFILPWETDLRKHRYNLWHDPIPLKHILPCRGVSETCAGSWDILGGWSTWIE